MTLVMGWDEAAFGEKTTGSDVGFLWDPEAYKEFVEHGAVKPRRCRWCASPLRFNTHGALLCSGGCDAGAPSADQVS